MVIGQGEEIESGVNENGNGLRRGKESESLFRFTPAFSDRAFQIADRKIRRLKERIDRTKNRIAFAIDYSLGQRPAKHDIADKDQID